MFLRSSASALALLKRSLSRSSSRHFQPISARPVPPRSTPASARAPSTAPRDVGERQGGQPSLQPPRLREPSAVAFHLSARERRGSSPRAARAPRDRRVRAAGRPVGLGNAVVAKARHHCQLNGASCCPGSPRFILSRAASVSITAASTANQPPQRLARFAQIDLPSHAHGAGSITTPRKPDSPAHRRALTRPVVRPEHRAAGTRAELAFAGPEGHHPSSTSVRGPIRRRWCTS